MEPTCKTCLDSGWVLVTVDGREVARPCACRKNGILHNANIPLRFLGVKLRAHFPDKANPDQVKAKKAAERFIAEYPALTKGLLFQGPTGVGKTRLLCAIGNQLIEEKGAEVFYIDWNDLTREMRSGEDTSNRDFSVIGQLLNQLAGVPLLLFDEIGSSKPSPWVEDNIYYLINRRYNDNLLTLFATNYYDDKVVDPETLTDRIGRRIRSRLYEMTDAVRLSGADYRQRNL
ncbi:MAG TPA: ATP-binding protein [Candidatus Aminicenantes bacterium]|nr:ATP-binding protein [Candidatus Aminicenantes bacterium]